MKPILLFSLLFIGTWGFAQPNEGDDHPELDSATAVALPWYGDEHYHAVLDKSQHAVRLHFNSVAC